jgi:AAA ATPase domain
MEAHPPAPRRHPTLLGRADECALLDALVDAIRRGEGRALVVRGEAGIGKTALLEYLVRSAPDVTVLRAVGVESEMELAYAGLHQLCASLLDRLDRLPTPQRQALEIAYGLSAGEAPDRFLVGLAVLSLLSAALPKWTRRSSEASGPRLGPRERPFRAQSRLFAPMVIGQVEPPRLGPFPRSGTGPPGGLSGDGCSRAESRAPPNGPDGR